MSVPLRRTPSSSPCRKPLATEKWLDEILDAPHHELDANHYCCPIAPCGQPASDTHVNPDHSGRNDPLDTDSQTQ